MKRVIHWIRNLINRWKQWGFYRTLVFYLCQTYSREEVEKWWEQRLKKLPLGNILVFECENDMDDNARALFDYLQAKGYGKKYRMVWIVKDLRFCEERYGAKNVRFVRREFTGEEFAVELYEDTYEKMRFQYYQARAKFFFLTHPYWMKNWRSGQTVVNLDHGAAPIKAKGANPEVGKTFDYIIAPSEHVTPWKTVFWHCNEEKVLILGGPRNDWIFSGTREKTIAPFFQVKPQEKIIIIMPTFRQTKGWKDCDKVDRFCMSVVETQQQMEQLDSTLANCGVHVLVKIHPLQSMEGLDTKDYSHIHYLTNRDLHEKDIHLNEMIGCCDGMITDFSSVYFDFLLVNRPIGFFLNDASNYHRGFIMENPEDYMPGEKIVDYDGLVQFILHLANGVDDYCNQRTRVNDLINYYQDDKNCERLADYFKL